MTPNNHDTNKTLKIKNSHSKQILLTVQQQHIFSFFNTVMHVAVNINYPRTLSSPTIKNAIMKLRDHKLIEWVISACKNNI